MNKQEIIKLLEHELQINKHIYDRHVEEHGDDNEVVYNGKYNHPEKWVRICYRNNFLNCQDTLSHIKNGGGYMVKRSIEVVCNTDIEYTVHNEIQNWNGED
ncbi:hypothetical protein TaPaz_155 [Acinetobacter phage TaPaz]|nr:hypothetical protein TaPaz_155 [Acinetobacter phage TaPaz]